MSNNNQKEEQEENVVWIESKQFETVIEKKYTRSGKVFLIERKVLIEPELPAKKTFRRGPGRPKKKKEVKSMDGDVNLDMGKLMDEAINTVENKNDE